MGPWQSDPRLGFNPIENVLAYQPKRHLCPRQSTPIRPPHSAHSGATYIIFHLWDPATSKHLNHIIKSSALLEYSMKLQAMAMIDNSARSYGDVSLDERLALENTERGGRTRPVRASLRDLRWRAMNLTSRRYTRRRYLQARMKLSSGPRFVPQLQTLILSPVLCLSKKTIFLLIPAIRITVSGSCRIPSTCPAFHSTSVSWIIFSYFGSFLF